MESVDVMAGADAAIISGKHVLPQVVSSKPKGSVFLRSASLAEPGL